MSYAKNDQLAVVKPQDLPWNHDAPEGQAWKCPDCASWATLGGNAAYHVMSARHGMPSLRAIPPLPGGSREWTQVAAQQCSADEERLRAALRLIRDQGIGVHCNGALVGSTGEPWRHWAEIAAQALIKGESHGDQPRIAATVEQSQTAGSLTWTFLSGNWRYRFTPNGRRWAFSGLYLPDPKAEEQSFGMISGGAFDALRALLLDSARAVFDLTREDVAEEDWIYCVDRLPAASGTYEVALWRKEWGEVGLVTDTCPQRYFDPRRGWEPIPLDGRKVYAWRLARPRLPAPPLRRRDLEGSVLADGSAHFEDDLARLVP